MVLSLERALLLLASAVFATGILASLAAALGVFRWFAPLILLLGFAALVLVFLVFGRGKVRVQGVRADVAAAGLALLAAVSAGALHHLYFQGQMDIGFYVHDAATIATTGGRTLTGPADDLLPGVAPVEGGARGNAMFGYSSLAALFAYVGGIELAPWVNAVLAPITVLALYCVARQLGAAWGGVIAAAFYATSLLTLWFQRWVMTENAATAVIWIAVVLVLPLWKNWDWWRAAALGLALGFGALARPEGVLLLGWCFGLLAFRHRQRVHGLGGLRPFATPRRRRATLLAMGLGLVGLLIALQTLPGEYLSANMRLLENVRHGLPIPDSPDVPTTGPGPHWGDYALRYEWDSFAAYLLPWFVAAALVGVFLGTLRWRPALVVLVVILPHFAWILMPPVTTFHPWFMRRLWLAVVPAAYLFAGVALDPWRPRFAFRGPLRKIRASGLVFAAALVALGLAHLDVTAPLALRRETDDSRDLLRDLDRTLPPGAIVLADDAVVGYGIGLRYAYGRDVAPVFIREIEAILRAIELESTGRPAFLLRLNTSLPVHILRTDEAGTKSIRNFPVEIGYARRENHRAYLAHPPLEMGYDPLAKYLGRDVPPATFVDADVTVSLVETISPLVVQRGAFFSVSDWRRGEGGMEPQSPKSDIVLDPNAFPDHGVNLALSLVVPAGGRPTVQAYVNGTYVSPTTQSTLAGDRGFEVVSFFFFSVAVPERLAVAGGVPVRGLLVREF